MASSDEFNRLFGSGEVGGDKYYTPPLHASIKSTGKPVTFSQGQEKHDGDVLIADGHKDGTQFYDKKQHDHYKSDGTAWKDRGAYTDDK